MPNLNREARQMEARKLIEDYIISYPSELSPTKVQDLKCRLRALCIQPELDVDENVDLFVGMKQMQMGIPFIRISINTFISALSPRNAEGTVNAADDTGDFSSLHGNLEKVVGLMREEARGELEGTPLRNRLDHFATLLDGLITQVAELRHIMEGVVELKTFWESKFHASTETAEKFKDETTKRFEAMEKANTARTKALELKYDTFLEEAALKTAAASEKVVKVSMEKDAAKASADGLSELRTELYGTIHRLEAKLERVVTVQQFDAALKRITDLEFNLAQSNLRVQHYSDALLSAKSEWSAQRASFYGRLDRLLLSSEAGERAAVHLDRAKVGLKEARTEIERLKNSENFEKDRYEEFRAQFDALAASHKSLLESQEAHVKAGEEAQTCRIALELEVAGLKQRADASDALIDTCTAAMRGVSTRYDLKVLY